MTETEISKNKNKGVIEYVEKPTLGNEIIYWENKLKHIEWEYSHSYTIDWPKIRERELYFIREIARLKRLKSEKKQVTSCSRVINNTIVSEEKKDNNNNTTTDNNEKNIVQSHKEEIMNEEEQWDINNKLLLKSFEEEEVDLIKEMMNQVDCEHDWIKGKGDYNIKCAFCIYYPSQENRSTCSLCLSKLVPPV